MRLGEGLRIIQQATGERQRQIHLLCGFTPLHFATFVRAYSSLRFPGDSICLHTGLYGDLEGNIQRARDLGAEGAIAVAEWDDFDPRLGLRSSSDWGLRTLDDIATQAEEKSLRLAAHLTALAEVMPVTFVAPTLSLPPLSHLPPTQTSDFELHLNAILNDFVQSVCKLKRIRLLSASYLAICSPPNERHDIQMDLSAGFPYSPAHADALAQLSVGSLFPAAPKKGLITDLDETLWRGVLGDFGVEGISWSLEGKSQAHALYQKVLASLAESGVLVAIASKNNPKLVEAALRRSDLLLPSTHIFPIEVSWGAKSDAIGRILKTWNIGPDSVVFVDDSPMELAEVSEKHPGIECLKFPSDDPKEILALLWQLRIRFGKQEIREEDQLRVQSLRRTAKFVEEVPAEASADFLARLKAQLTFANCAVDHGRAFELVNKTNQFNLNGLRYTETEWKTKNHEPGRFLTTVSYEDRFGPLGKIAVLGGWMKDKRCRVDIFVMSCRAFSRHIEFQALQQLFAKSGAPVIRLHFRPTERNGPLQTFLGRFFQPESLAEGELDLSAAAFARSCPPLFHEVIFSESD